MLEIMKKLDYKLWGINIGIGIFFILTILFLYPDIDTDEDGIVEILQSVFITIAIVIFAYRAISSTDVNEKLTGFGLSLLSLSFLLRELDVEKFDIPSFFIWLGSGTGRGLFLGTLWIILIFLMYKYKNFQKIKMISFLTSTQGQLLMFAALMLIFGAFMDKNVFSLENLTTRFYEELFELLGYVYLAFSAIFKVKHGMHRA